MNNQTEPTIKIWRVNDSEWWAGESLESIRVGYQKQTGIDPDSEEGFDSPRLLDDEAMATKRVYFDEGELSDSGHTESFADALAIMVKTGRNFPCHFAGTEY